MPRNNWENKKEWNYLNEYKKQIIPGRNSTEENRLLEILDKQTERYK